MKIQEKEENRHWACSQRNGSDDSDPFLIWKPDFTLYECKSLSNQALEMWKKGVLDRDPPRKPDSEDLWTQSSFGRDLCVRIFEIRAEAMHCMHGSWVNLCSRKKILPRSAQILFVIGKEFAMQVNERSSNHEPNQETDRDPKWLSERDSFLCEQA